MTASEGDANREALRVARDDLMELGNAKSDLNKQGWLALPGTWDLVKYPSIVHKAVQLTHAYYLHVAGEGETIA